MRVDAEEPMSNRHLEAYPVVVVRLRDVLWLPGGHCVEISDPPRVEDRRRHRGGDAPDQLGCCSFGRDVLGPMHRVYQDGHPIDPPRMPAFAAPVELQAASHRSAIGRPIAILALEEEHDPADKPTMGSMWCHRQVRTSS
jgi:hypothetical protein